MFGRRLLLLSGLTLVMPGVACAQTDIVELLKTHKIVIGEHCFDENNRPCKPPPINPRNEIRLIKDVVINRSLLSRTGSIYPIGREINVLDHPLLNDGSDSPTQTKILYRKAHARSAKGQLVLFEKSGEVYDNTPGQTLHREYETTITLSAKSCIAVIVYKSRWDDKTGDPHRDSRSQCELVALSSEPAEEAAPKTQTLWFTNLNERAWDGEQSRKDAGFLLVKDRLFHAINLHCNANKELAVTFNWDGGLLTGKHDCDLKLDKNRTSKMKLTYKSSSKVEGNTRQLLSSSTHEVRTGASLISGGYEIDIRFTIEDGKCRIENFQRREIFGGTGGGKSIVQTADSESGCKLN